MKNNPMKLIITAIIVLAVIAGAWLVFGPMLKTAPNPNNSTTPLICNAPYIQVGTTCCLDVNNNLICDSDEQANTNQTVTPTPQPPITPNPIINERPNLNPVINQQELPQDKPGQPQLVITYMGKVQTQNTTQELNEIIQQGDEIKLKVTDPRYGTPLALTTLKLSNDPTQTATTDITGTATLNLTKPGIANITAYKEKFNKSNPYQINPYATYTAGRLYSTKGKNAKITTNSKWTAWQYQNDKGQHSIILKDNEKNEELEITSPTSNYQNPTIHPPYLLFENTTGEKTTLETYNFDKKEYKTLANRSIANYAPAMNKEQAMIITSATNNRNCLTDSKIEQVDTYNSPQRTLTNTGNQFALTWKENYLYFADFSNTQKCDYTNLETINIYKTNTGAIDPIKIITIYKPAQLQINALDYPYTVDATGFTYQTLSEEKTTTQIKHYTYTNDNIQILLQDNNITPRTQVHYTGKHLIWTQKAPDGNWHIKLHDLATQQEKWATYNNQNQTNLNVQTNTIYYTQNNQIYKLDTTNE